MTRPHPLTALKEREWAESWEEQQRVVEEQLNSQRGSWLPNVVERRLWGALRWTSGRPGHAATSGRAVAEKFVVIRPDGVDENAMQRVVHALDEPAPMMRILGFGLHRHHLIGMAAGAVGAAALLAAGAAAIGAGLFGIVLVVLLGLVGGAIGGSVTAQFFAERQRQAVLRDDQHLRLILGRYAPKSWLRLVEAASALESVLPRGASTAEGDPDAQTVEAIQIAMWEAAGLLLTSSDHTGMDVLAEGVERLERAHRRGIGR
ncbi:hypothetical protein EF847_13290 [Actinobacteria bacterium YIM 96077]|uniref:Uncharacterized protein n=1 Tax=Phytoactinopolyspora halophila TaxID=1981511 RepID=A0A329QKK3_9ACTN|nr:hypothetical protein [Phytoactinopolyspora halophila]AYY13524.1 hypothetical protein EF847_13290 [Actinobacteria bacterium YIM 96077]RAW12421.1 hypothetical protein DPM12_14755 [Phytoactinopolyspora halophila]